MMLKALKGFSESVRMTADTASPSPIVLVCDLDGTLCRTDTLEEAVLARITTDPMVLLRLPVWLLSGRAAFKARLADGGLLDPATLPLNKVVLDHLEAARAEGRRTALISASDTRQVEAVAAFTGLFDEACGTSEGRNLKGDAKAALLIERFGAKGFDYIGDAPADVPVWAAAGRAVTVGARPGLRRAAEAVNDDVTHLDPPVGKVQAALRALRPHQWSKNLLLFFPVLAAHDFSRPGAILTGFAAFCLVASAVYVINDLLDLAADRAHGRKRQRPFASGLLSLRAGVGLAAALLVGGAALGLATNSAAFFAVLAGYFALTLAYSMWLKRKLVIDIITLAGLYTIRIVAGAAAVAVPLSPWMLGFSMFLFLALAGIKRQAELTDLLASGRAAAGRAYEVDDLPVLRGLVLSASNAAVLVLALYISSDAVQALYNRPEILWLICPILLYWTLRMEMKTHRGAMTDDPIVYAASDPVSVVLIAAAGAVAVLATVLPPG